MCINASVLANLIDKADMSDASWALRGSCRGSSNHTSSGLTSTPLPSAMIPLKHFQRVFHRFDWPALRTKTPRSQGGTPAAHAMSISSLVSPKSKPSFILPFNSVSLPLQPSYLVASLRSLFRTSFRAVTASLSRGVIQTARRSSVLSA